MNKKKILVVGGGSGGHLTPLIAVANAIKLQEPSIEVLFVGQKGENLDEVMNHHSVAGRYYIQAGKFRRYHGESFLRHLMDTKTVFLNIRDFFRFLVGLFQAWMLLGKLQPSAIFLKGGYVCVPVGFAARLRKIPYITHDSDAIPGLANRLTGKSAVYNTTAMPADYYPYDKEKVRHVGIPLQPEFKFVTTAMQQAAKEKLGVKSGKLVVCTGGGTGARRLNLVVVQASKNILKEDATIIHLTGKKLFEETKDAYTANLDSEQLKKVKLIDFTTDMVTYMAAADLVISRAGATAIAELTVQGKPAVIVPSPFLTGGQQLHNAKVLQDTNAAYVLQERDLDKLGDAIDGLLHNDVARIKLGESLHTLAVDNAAETLATLLVSIAK